VGVKLNNKRVKLKINFICRAEGINVGVGSKFFLLAIILSYIYGP
jgi:hypothetical protein